MKTLLIIETIPGWASEAWALKEALDVMMVGWDGRAMRHLEIEVKEAFTKSNLRKLLQRDVDYLHISAHGGIVKRDPKNRHALYIGRSRKMVKPDDIRSWKPKARNVFISACHTGYRDLASAFFDFDKKKKGSFLAPVNEPAFDEAFLIALQFHRGAFLEGSNKRAERYVEELKSLKKTYNYFTFP